MSEPSRILIVVDPAQGFDQASIARGSLLATSLEQDIELLIVHADREFTDLRVKNPAGWKTARHKVVNAHADQLEGFAAILKARGHSVVLSVTCDWPLDDGIVRHAIYTRPKMMVKEVKTRGRLGRALFGDADWNLIRHCPQPLWLAKSGEWENGAPIMACVDPGHRSDSYSTLDLRLLGTAEELSRKLVTDLHVFNAYPPEMGTVQSEDNPVVTPEAEFEKQYAQQQKILLDSLLDGYDVEEEHIHRELGYPESTLVKTADRIGAGLVVMGAIARNRLDRIILGSTTEAVLDKVPADILVVKPSWFECPVNALSHADTGYDPEGHIFQVEAGTRPEWAGNRQTSVE